PAKPGPSSQGEEGKPEELGQQIEAVQEFDQRGQMPDQRAGDQGQAVGEDLNAEGSAHSVLMEQWLDGIEGDPAYLMRNRFLFEEMRRIQPSARGGPLYEPRPW
ncbi:MAG: hypothetical protein H7842_12290, partial [Gammaproteobacteria bacterium SHHR-1]